jgi:hypothetical protein
MSLSTSDVIHMLLGVLTIVAFVYFNRQLYLSDWRGGMSALESSYYLVAVAALLIGWYFNIQYMSTYGDDVGWIHWTKLLFVNPASASGGQDLIFANVVLMPLWTISEGRRCGMRASWWYFPMSLLTSFAFAIALFLAAQQRQHRWNQGRIAAS